jgi:hypothetical protein
MAERSKVEATSSSSAAGFKRVIEHEDGNWPSHVYLIVPRSRQVNGIAQTCFSHYTSHSTDHREMSACEEFHISLTRPFVLRLHQIEPFLRSLARRITLFESIQGTYLSRLYNLLPLLASIDNSILFQLQCKYLASIFH